MSWRGLGILGWCNGVSESGPGTTLEKGPLLFIWWASVWSKHDISWSISLISSSKSLVGGNFKLVSILNLTWPAEPLNFRDWTS